MTIEVVGGRGVHGLSQPKKPVKPTQKTQKSGLGWVWVG